MQISWLILPLILSIFGSMGCGLTDRSTPALRETAGPSTPRHDGAAEPEQVTWLDAEALRAAIGDRREEAWRRAYLDQRERNRWPEVLSERFRQCVQTLGRDEDLPAELCEEYKVFAARYVERLNPNPKVFFVPQCEWNETAFESLQTGFQWAECPTTRQVRLAQEDLWCLLSILYAIRATNEEVYPVHRQFIKSIQILDIGTKAASVMEQIQQEIAIREYFGGRYVFENWTAGWDGNHVLAETEESDLNGLWPKSDHPDSDITNRRYVDFAGNPLPGDAQTYPEFRLLPVRLVILVARTTMPSLLTSFATVPSLLDHLEVGNMPLEVKNVEILESKSAHEPDRVQIVGVIRIYNPPE